MENTVRSDQVGSLARPEELTAVRADFFNGKIDAAAFEAELDRMITEVVEAQKAVGIGVVTDGEFRRLFYGGGVVAAIDGYKPGTLGDVEKRLSKKERFVKPHEIALLKAIAPDRFKTTMPTPIRIRPEMVAFLFPDAEVQMTPPAPYADWDEVQSDLTDMYVDEVAAHVAEGVPYVQFDNVILPYVDPAQRAAIVASGADPDAELAKEIVHFNRAYAPAKGKAIRAMHFCRGNRGKTDDHFGQGGYEPVAERIFGELEIDRYLMEFDTSRAGGFEPLRFVPKGKTIVLGLVTTKSEELEDADDLVRRIEEASQFCPIDQLAIGPQCGFSSGATSAHMTRDEQMRKLERVVEVAQRVWG